ncbi:MAG: DUF4175 family protein [Leeuwenhoekiella sp.]
MSAIQHIERKITAFISKYYKNELIRGTLLFVAIGGAYLLLNLAIEYFLWLNPLGRTLMFWSFVAVLLVVFVRLIGLPLLRLLKLSKGLGLEDASKMIGEHFPEVSDKLVNVLQLYSSNTDSELVLASITQKQKELEPVPFSKAVDYRKNFKYLKFALLPVLLFVILGLTSGESFFGGSYSRFVNYDKAYQPPAPFEFLISAEDLRAIEQQPFTINVTTSGEQRPEMVTIKLDDQEYLMKGRGDGSFSFVIQQPTEDLEFYVEANGVRSRDFTLEVIPTPLITKFEMQLNYPAYTGLRDEILQNTGSANVPEGTEVTWKLEALATDNIDIVTRDTTENFKRNETKSFDFQYNKKLFRDFAYGIVTSNSDLKDYERLNYQLAVTQDRRPTIDVALRKDTVSGEQHYHQGSVSDDYGVSRLEMVYELGEKPSEATVVKLAIGRGTADEFFAVFPGNLPLEAGKSYRYYFQVFDNDGVNGAKRSRSETFEYRKRTTEELQQEQITQQKESIEKIDRTLQRQKEAKTEFRELRNTQLEKEKLNFTDQQQLKNFLEKQRQQDAMMQQFSKQMQENLERFQDTKNENDPQNEALQERLKRNEERLKRQEKLLEELAKVQDKLLKEELTEKLDQLAKQSKNSTRNLEQLLELTKRYYVQQKINQASEKLTDLGKKQEELSEKSEENTSKKQEELSKEFDALKKELEDLNEENEQLKDPMKLPGSEDETDQIDALQKEAEDLLKEGEQEKSNSGDQEEKQEQDQSPQSQKNKKSAQKKQKSAGNKLQQMGQKMKSSMMQGGSQMEQLEEDVKMLRQVLDNLITFSFEEEDLMEDFRDIDNSSPLYSKKLIKQQVLKENFQHIDDSLFALSLRNVQMGEKINEELTNADYSMNQALERFANNDVNQGVSSQQYVITAANTLADMLSEVLDNMQQQLSMSQGSSGGGPPMPSPGNSPGQGDQLQDIIMNQEQLAQQGQSGGKEGEGQEGKGAQNGQQEGGDQGEKGQGQSQQQGEGEQQGSEGATQNGEKGSDGKQGGDGQYGEAGGNEGMSEAELAEQYEIYKRQQQLRNQLEDLLRQNGETEKQQALLKELEIIEDNLLENGITKRSRQRMLNVVHELIKMKEAAQEQGQKQERESQTNLEDFGNEVNSIELKAKEYFSNKEILSREMLPLDGHYRKKAQAYFNDTDN